MEAAEISVGLPGRPPLIRPAKVVSLKAVAAGRRGVRLTI